MDYSEKNTVNPPSYEVITMDNVPDPSLEECLSLIRGSLEKDFKNAKLSRDSDLFDINEWYKEKHAELLDKKSNKERRVICAFERDVLAHQQRIKHKLDELAPLQRNQGISYLNQSPSWLSWMLSLIK